MMEAEGSPTTSRRFRLPRQWVVALAAGAIASAVVWAVCVGQAPRSAEPNTPRSDPAIISQAPATQPAPANPASKPAPSPTAIIRPSQPSQPGEECVVLRTVAGDLVVALHP